MNSVTAFHLMSNYIYRFLGGRLRNSIKLGYSINIANTIHIFDWTFPNSHGTWFKSPACK